VVLRLNSGAFSVVKEAVQRDTGTKVAIKFIGKKYVSSKEIDLVEREIDIMKRLEHKNIIKLIEVLESADEIYIVMELYVLGNHVLISIV
jgi:serine/threonine protein kinase